MDRYEVLEDLGLTFIHRHRLLNQPNSPVEEMKLTPEDCDVREMADGSLAIACPRCHDDIAFFNPRT